MLTFEQYNNTIDESLTAIVHHIFTQMREGEVNEALTDKCGSFIRTNGNILDSIKNLITINADPNKYADHPALQGKTLGGCIDALKANIADKLEIPMTHDNEKAVQAFNDKLQKVLQNLEDEIRQKMNGIPKSAAILIVNRVRDAIKKLA